MLITYFSADFALRRLRTPDPAHVLDSFAECLARNGYARRTGRGYLRAAGEFLAWAASTGEPIANLDEAAVARFAKATRRRAGPIRRRPRAYELAY